MQEKACSRAYRSDMVANRNYDSRKELFLKQCAVKPHGKWSLEDQETDGMIALGGS